jgi:predicted lipoprotein with Yx(FWY)xxD motif
MNKHIYPALILALLIAGCGGYGSGSGAYMPPGGGNAAPASSTPAITQTILGSPGLATPQGFTLYEFSADGMGVSNCTGSCAAVWPPFAAASGAQATGNFTVMTRSDGSHQWAYKGHPLYTFSGDTQAGQANGQNQSVDGGTFTVARP